MSRPSQQLRNERTLSNAAPAAAEVEETYGNFGNVDGLRDLFQKHIDGVDQSALRFTTAGA